MSYKQIPNLPPIIAASSDMLFEAAQGGSSGKVSLDVLFQFINDRIESYLVLPTRDLFVARIISGHYNGLSNGWVVEAGGYTYRRSIGATDINDMPDWVPHGTISINHFQTTATPSTTDRSAALLAAIEYAASIATDERVDVSGDWEDVAVASMVTLNALPGGVRLDKMRLVAIGSWAGTLGTLPAKLGGAACPQPILNVTNSDMFALGAVTIECNFKSSGIRFVNSGQCRTEPLTYIHGMGANGYGLRTQTQAVEFISSGTKIEQFAWGETGFDVQANRTAVGFLMETADFTLISPNANYCLAPIYKGDGYNWQIIGAHVYNGALTTVTDPLSIWTLVIDSPEGGVVSSMYADRGAVWINCDNLTSAGGDVLIFDAVNHATGGVGDPSTYKLVLSTSVAGNDLAGLSITNNRFPNEADNLNFEVTGAGSFVDPLFWNYFGNAQRDGAPVTGAPMLFGVNGNFRLGTSGDFYFGKTQAATLASAKSITISADYDANSAEADSRVNFSTDGVVRGYVTATGMVLTGLLSGTAVTQTNIDTTAGRLLKVGDFGLGGVITLADLNAAPTASGFYRTNGSTANIPAEFPHAFGTVLVEFYSSTDYKQTWTANYGSTGKHKFSRFYSGGAWSAWTMAYSQANLLGTVSQTAGVPTGAVIDRGTIATGEYVRFADGTQVVTGVVPAMAAIGTADGALFKAAANVTVAISKAFIAAPTVQGGQCSDADVWLAPVGSATGSVTLRPRSTVSKASGVTGAFTAIGRWF